MELSPSYLKNKPIQNKILKQKDKISNDIDNQDQPKKEEKKMMRAISIARKLNPKVNF